jgi:tagatose 6-phosphate kinase
MITTVTLNPMLDKTVYVASLLKGETQRASRVELTVGGKGVNVSRQLHALGDDTLATGFVGGEIGDMLERLLTEEGIHHDFVRIRGMTREGVTYREGNGSVTAVFEPPHQVSPDDARHLVNHCVSLMQHGDWMVCSGSSPCIEADGVFEELIEKAGRRGVLTVLDSYGDAFARGVGAGPTLVKPNKDEFEQTFHSRLERESDYRAALATCLERGITYCIFTDGPRPAYAAHGDGMWKIVPASVEAVNATASGDSMLAGVLHGLQQGWPFERCIAFGAAAGAANARRWEVAQSSIAEITELEDQIIVQKL